jgi:hypothetical protein
MSRSPFWGFPPPGSGKPTTIEEDAAMIRKIFNSKSYKSLEANKNFQDFCAETCPKADK